MSAADDQLQTAATMTSAPLLSAEDLFRTPTRAPQATLGNLKATEAPYVDASDRLLFDPDELERQGGGGYQLPGTSVVNITPMPQLTGTPNPLLDPAGTTMAAAANSNPQATAAAAAAAAAETVIDISSPTPPPTPPPPAKWRTWLLAIVALITVSLLCLLFALPASSGNSGGIGGGGLAAGLGSDIGGLGMGGGGFGGGGMGSSSFGI